MSNKLLLIATFCLAVAFSACKDLLPGPRNCGSNSDSTGHHHNHTCTADSILTDSTTTDTTAVVNP